MIMTVMECDRIMNLQEDFKSSVQKKMSSGEENQEE